MIPSHSLLNGPMYNMMKVSPHNYIGLEMEREEKMPALAHRFGPKILHFLALQ